MVQVAKTMRVEKTVVNKDVGG
ncbi:hypothetical protein PR001_g29669, partial [Phytophthora rubi]